jgi:hypothetical protein
MAIGQKDCLTPTSQATADLALRQEMEASVRGFEVLQVGAESRRLAQEYVRLGVSRRPCWMMRSTWRLQYCPGGMSW